MEQGIELEGVFTNGYGFIPKTTMVSNLSLQAKGVYAYLCSFSGRGNDVFPSRKKMCYDLNISNDSLGKYLKELKDNNYIEIKQEKEAGKFKNNIYKINLNLPCPKTSVSENLDTNNNIDTNNNKHIYKQSEKFVPPTLDEVKDYCLNVRHNDVDYQYFYDYFTTGHWIDSQGNKVRNWKQKIITWEKKGSSNSNNKNKVVYDSI